MRANCIENETQDLLFRIAELRESLNFYSWQNCYTILLIREKWVPEALSEAIWIDTLENLELGGATEVAPSPRESIADYMLTGRVLQKDRG